jgi:uncharacterized protein YkwD
MSTTPTRRLLVLVLGALLPVSNAAGAEQPSATAKPAQHATLKTAASMVPDIPLHEYDWDAEQRLLELANQARAQAGASALTLDSGLSQAARAHAFAMFEARQISHRFEGEPSLAQRLAASTSLQLDQDAENVAFDFDVAQGHQHLMLSPPHRANLLNPAYNVVGLGVVRSGDRLYIVEDFGHALHSYSVAEVKERVAAALNQMRRKANEPGLRRRDLSAADETACSMTRADKLGTSAIQKLAQRFTVLTFTSLDPNSLPAGSNRAITGPNLRSFSVGACYGRTQTYPTGAYWVVLSLD